MDACQHVRRLYLKLCNMWQVCVPEVVHAEPKGAPAAHALFVQRSPNTQSAAVTPYINWEHWQLLGRKHWQLEATRTENQLKTS